MGRVILLVFGVRVCRAFLLCLWHHHPLSRPLNCALCESLLFSLILFHDVCDRNHLCGTFTLPVQIPLHPADSHS